MTIDIVDCYCINLLLQNHAEKRYRVFYRAIKEFTSWQFMDIDALELVKLARFDTDASGQTLSSDQRVSSGLSVPSFWSSIRSEPTMTSISPIAVSFGISGLMANTQYEICIAPKFTERRLTTTISTRSTGAMADLYENKEQKQESIKDDHDIVSDTDLYGFVCISNLYKYSYTASMGFDITCYDGIY